MIAAAGRLDGPDLAQGIASGALAEGALLLGHARGEPVLLARCRQEVFAVGAHCTHSGAPLVDGMLVGATVRCPWHHACFSLRTGAPLRAPAFDPLASWHVEQRDGVVYVGESREQQKATATAAVAGGPKSIVIVGGGAAGNAAAETLRREGHGGRITMLSAHPSRPCNRPNLSKGFLAGTSAGQCNVLRSSAFYLDRRIDLQLDAPVARLDIHNRRVQCVDGKHHGYDALLLATGAEPVRLDIPGAALRHVHYLRTLANGRSLVADASTSRRAVVIGASFIGLETAASLRARNIDVHVVAPDAIPMQKVLGPEVGTFLRGLHERNGVTFHLGNKAISIDKEHVRLQNGEVLRADLVVVGIGVRPVTALAEQAAIAIERGICVNEYLETSVPGIFAAGDIARWADLHSGERIRVEHWVVAERQGQTAARNMLGAREKFDAVPFFWSQHYDATINYVGHAERWDEAEVDGDLEASGGGCTITYKHEGRKLAVAVVHRDFEGLRAEVEFERTIARQGISMWSLRSPCAGNCRVTRCYIRSRSCSVSASAHTTGKSGK
jgi:NADPH-dependent 2,4-dienoyl-CoA reductase/sulfur reductase-like enzyme/nitrite reductase/ring-hydroxylating ferredoxin subunit